MGAVLPKVSIYLFLSVICLLINISMLVSGLIATSTNNDIDDFMKYKEFTVTTEEATDVNISASDFAFTTSVAFVPFFSLLPVTFIDFGLPDLFVSLWGVIIIIISTVQALLLLLIALNFVPKFLGSGFDV